MFEPKAGGAVVVAPNAGGLELLLPKAKPPAVVLPKALFVAPNDVVVVVVFPNIEFEVVVTGPKELFDPNELAPDFEPKLNVG